MDGLESFDTPGLFLAVRCINTMSLNVRAVRPSRAKNLTIPHRQSFRRSSCEPETGDEENDFYSFDTRWSPALDALTLEELALDADHLSTGVLDEFLSATIDVPNKKKRRIDWDLSGSTSKRLKTICFEKYMYIDQSPDPDDQDTIVVAPPRPVTHHHLSCPFYVWDSETYRDCLRGADLREISDVKRHLCTVHRQPSYCPICRETFTSSTVCNQHIRARACKHSKDPIPSGITILQMQQLAHPAESWVSRELQWLSLWEIVFPRTALPLLSSTTETGSPRTAAYLTGELEAVVCVFRDFWSSNGSRIVSDFMSKNKESQGSEGSRSPTLERECRSQALGSMVLERVIDQLVTGCLQKEKERCKRKRWFRK
ncbi:hypothetical protein F5Y16DRAFT_408935 [Xylariaceae sp. FL0255]|nr:hypothetical protein F5Y16DRAFT_408935 [Xylariaceae sp. FL0255]